MKGKPTVAVLLGLAVVTSGCTSITPNGRNAGGGEEMTLPVKLMADPVSIPSGRLTPGNTYNFTIQVQVNTLANTRGGQRVVSESGTLKLIGKNVTTESEVLWEGELEKGMDRTSTVEASPQTESASLKVTFIHRFTLENGTTVKNTRDISQSLIERAPDATGVQGKEGYPS